MSFILAPDIRPKRPHVLRVPPDCFPAYRCDHHGNPRGCLPAGSTFCSLIDKMVHKKGSIIRTVDH